MKNIHYSPPLRGIVVIYSKVRSAKEYWSRKKPFDTVWCYRLVRKSIERHKLGENKRVSDNQDNVRDTVEIVKTTISFETSTGLGVTWWVERSPLTKETWVRFHSGSYISRFCGPFPTSGVLYGHSGYLLTCKCRDYRAIKHSLKINRVNECIFNSFTSKNFNWGVTNFSLLAWEILSQLKMVGENNVFPCYQS